MACRGRLFAPEPHPDAPVWAERIAPATDGRTRFELCLALGRGDMRAGRSAPACSAPTTSPTCSPRPRSGSSSGSRPSRSPRALGQVSPPEHRLAPIVNRARRHRRHRRRLQLQPRRRRGGARGARRRTRQRRRVLVTPGMVELGDRARTPRTSASAPPPPTVCDLVDPRRRSRPRRSARGLERAGFPGGSLPVVARLRRRPAAARRDARARGDVILFENDLPDLYSAGRRGDRRLQLPESATAASEPGRRLMVGPPDSGSASASAGPRSSTTSRSSAPSS